MPFTKQPHAEPIPGYRLLSPLGCGGFGEVWKCEAPGGLFKAIKFVYGNLNGVQGDATQAHEELQAVHRIKDIRHPFLLSIDRVECRSGELMIVTELADKNLHEVLVEYQQRGCQGVAREELLRYLAEAAEVLDLINDQHGLQHLDVKPRNFFLVGNHVKVADFGLVTSMTGSGIKLGAVTPLYASPEVLQGSISRTSDQYSLACCYMELLTGKVPFVGHNSRQLYLQHVNDEPDLSALPDVDRPIVARALAKDSARRHPGCVDFIRALQGQRPPVEPVPPSAAESSVCEAMTQTPNGRRLSDTAKASPAGLRPVLAGYQFLEGLDSSLLTDVWKATGPDGRPCQVKFIYGFAGRAEESVRRLKALHHPGLPQLDIVRSDPGCLVLAHEHPLGTLRGRWIKCQSQNLAGIPRVELLGYLRTVAEILDYLYQQHSISHLMLNPRALMLSDVGLQVDNFGLAQLFWIPGGQAVAQRNARYAAPELFDGQCHRTSDQFSLAVIYQELLTSTHPFHNQVRQPGTGARPKFKPDLSALPETDTQALARALSADPWQRWPSCTDLVRALEGDDGPIRRHATGGASALREVIVSPEAPAVPAASAAPAQVQQILKELLADTAGLGIGEEACEQPQVSPSGDVVTHRFRAGLPIGAGRVKVDAFRQQCNGQVLRDDDTAYEFHVTTPTNFWRQWMGRQPGLDVRVQLNRTHPLSATPIDVAVTIAAAGCGKKKGAQLIQDLGLNLLEGLRTFLLVHSEKRTQDRLLWPHPVEVCGIEVDGTVGPPTLCRGKDISLGGDRVLLAARTADAAGADPPADVAGGATAADPGNAGAGAALRRWLVRRGGLVPSGRAAEQLGGDVFDQIKKPLAA